MCTNKKEQKKKQKQHLDLPVIHPSTYWPKLILLDECGIEMTMERHGPEATDKTHTS